MLKVQREKNESGLVLKLSGVLEESLILDDIFGPPEPEMNVFCKEVLRINSVGVKAWIKYFQKAASLGSKLKFHECSPTIVEQINNISNFTCGGDVVSMCLPFICENCGVEYTISYRTDEVKAANFEIIAPKCTKCGGNVVFDDIPEEFFSFMDY